MSSNDDDDDNENNDDDEDDDGSRSIMMIFLRFNWVCSHHHSSKFFAFKNIWKKKEKGWISFFLSGFPNNSFIQIQF